MRQVLYYPGILIPHDWLKKSIFYSDKISSIYPNENMEITGQEEQLALTNMEYLESLGLYKKTNPEELDYWTHTNIFTDMTSLLDELTLEKMREIYQIHRSSYQIFLSKMGSEVRGFLLENQLARYDPLNSGSLLVESNVGLLYMSILAHHSTKVNTDYTTSTDEIQNQNIIFNRNNSLSNDFYLNLVLNEIPSPSPLTPIEDIIRFKSDRRQDLLTFRRYIMEWTEKIQNNSRSLNTFRDEFELYKQEMNRIMNGSGIATVGSTLEIVIPPLSGLAAQYYANEIERSDVISAAASTIASFTINKIKSKLGNNTRIQENTPLSYLYHAHRAQIL